MIPCQEGILEGRRESGRDINENAFTRSIESLDKFTDRWHSSLLAVRHIFLLEQINLFARSPRLTDRPLPGWLQKAG
jgi:hypothetical protein